MKWEHVRPGEFEKALEECAYTCILPVGALEPHGYHLPIGTDYFAAKANAEAAAEIEPCMVFPAMFLGSVYESMAMKGAVTLPVETLFRLYFDIFDEIARNGFKKIILYSGHGGNMDFLREIVLASVHTRKPYTLFLSTTLTGLCSPEDKQMMAEDCEGRRWGHGCEWETSVIMNLAGEDVDLTGVPDEVTVSPDAPEDLHPRVFTAVDWFAKTPKYYVGNPCKASAERGKRYSERAAKNLAEIIKSVKENTSVERRTEEYYQLMGR